MENENLEEIRAMRIRYSTVVNYIAHIYQMLMALLFSLMVIRKLSYTDYGLFSSIFAVIMLINYVPELWNYWVNRYYSRKKYQSVANCASLTIIYSVLSIGLVLLLLILLDIMPDTLTFIFIVLYVSLNMIINFYSILLNVNRPYLAGYRNIVSSTVRVAVAYLTVVVLHMGITGIFIALLGRSIIQLIMIYYFIKHYKIIVPRITIDTDEIVRILKNLFIPLIYMIPQQIKVSFEKLITLGLTNNLILPAYLGVSYVPRSLIIGSTNVFSRNIYIRCLKGFSKKDIEDLLRLTFITLIFIAGILIVYSKTILSILKPGYIVALPLFILYILAFTIDTLRASFGAITTGLERMDLYASGLKLRHSYLFKNSFLVAMGTLAYISISVVIFAYEYISGIRDPVQLLLPFPIFYTISHAIILYIFYKRSRKVADYDLPIKELGNAVISVIIMYIITNLLGLNNIIVYNIREQIIPVLLNVVISTLIYIGFLYLLSQWFRRFIYNSIKNII